MTGKRAIELLHKLINVYLDQEKYEVAIRCLLRMGFTPIELVNEFNFTINEIVNAIENGWK